jgi:hypothetical protein
MQLAATFLSRLSAFNAIKQQKKLFISIFASSTLFFYLGLRNFHRHSLHFALQFLLFFIYALVTRLLNFSSLIFLNCLFYNENFAMCRARDSGEIAGTFSVFI